VKRRCARVDSCGKEVITSSSGIPINLSLVKAFLWNFIYSTKVL
jgi:hypothetical protein